MSTFGLVMICKDEVHRIARCLESLRPHLAHWTILDTGSHDGTQDVIRETMAGIPGALHEEPFVNFGVNRSRAFALARGTCDWLVAADADMTWEIESGWEPDPAFDAHMVRMGTGVPEWWLPLVMRGDLPWVSIGSVHEYSAIEGPPYRSAKTDAVRIVSGHIADASPEKLRWHERLLREELEREPDQPRATFYLAQTLRDLGEPAAIDLYRRRAAMDNSEEAFCAAYAAASLEPEWPAKQAALMAAWEMRPARLEPLYDLVHGLNERGQHHAAYRLSETPAEVPSDVLFVYPSVWDWGMPFERSIAAWWVGRRDEVAALSEALLTNPRLPAHIRQAVQRNLGLTLQQAA